MQQITREEYVLNKDVLLRQILKGTVFIHPTDTIYGIGCDATNDEAVQKIRDIKNRPENPFSIMAPSKDWIYKNCDVSRAVESWLDKLPGPYTLILRLKHKGAIASSVNNSGDTVGVRMPDHWFHDISQELDKPIVTTSANISGEDFMTSLENLSEDIRQKISLFFYEGDKKGKPSKVIDLTGDEHTVLRG